MFLILKSTKSESKPVILRTDIRYFHYLLSLSIFIRLQTKQNTDLIRCAIFSCMTTVLTSNEFSAPLLAYQPTAAHDGP